MEIIVFSFVGFFGSFFCSCCSLFLFLSYIIGNLFSKLFFLSADKSSPAAEEEPPQRVLVLNWNVSLLLFVVVDL